MTKGTNMREVQEDYAKKVVGLCMICGKPAYGWYGVWQGGGTCNKYCEDKQESKPKYPDHPETFGGEDDFRLDASG